MPCYHPLKAFQVGDSKPVFSMPAKAGFSFLQLPCGQCVGCRLERSRQWAVRCLHEAQMYSDNCFLTLTYRPESLGSMSLVFRDFQLFMKRFRRRFPKSTIRYYMCGEYGDVNSRPHFHACVFGFDFADKVFYKLSASGCRLYTSAICDELWTHGFCILGDVNFESAAYVARYVMKKVVDGAKAHEIVDPDTGEIFKRVKEFGRMSLKPGIGARWLEKFSRDVYPEGKVVVRGVEATPPRYYDKIFELEDAVAFDAMKARRRFAAELHFEDGSPRRLRVKERVVQARVGLLFRS